MTAFNFGIASMAYEGQTHFSYPAFGTVTEVRVNGSPVAFTVAEPGKVAIAPVSQGASVAVIHSQDITSVGPYFGGGGTVTPPTPWTPAADTSGVLVNWIDISDAATVTDAGGGAISQINDKSGNGKNWVQASAGKRGTRAVTSFALPTLTIPGGGGYTPAAGFSLPQSLAFQGNADGGAGFSISLNGASGPAGDATSYPRTGLFAAHWANGAALGNGQPNTGIFFVDGAAVAASYGGDETLNPTAGGLVITASRIKSNGQGTSYGRFFDPGTPTLGNRSSDWGRTLDADIGELIYLSGTVSAALRQQYEGYLAWKWGLQANLPSGHPYKSAAPTA